MSFLAGAVRPTATGCKAKMIARVRVFRPARCSGSFDPVEFRCKLLNLPDMGTGFLKRAYRSLRKVWKKTKAAYSALRIVHPFRNGLLLRDYLTKIDPSYRERAEGTKACPVDTTGDLVLQIFGHGRNPNDRDSNDSLGANALAYASVQLASPIAIFGRSTQSISNKQ